MWEDWCRRYGGLVKGIMGEYWMIGKGDNGRKMEDCQRVYWENVGLDQQRGYWENIWEAWQRKNWENVKLDCSRGDIVRMWQNWLYSLGSNVEILLGDILGEYWKLQRGWRMLGIGIWQRGYWENVGGYELRWDIGRILDMIIDHGIQRGLRECLKIVAGINWKNAG